MKKILSISVGSSSRNHVTEQEFLGQVCHLERRGTDGDFDRAVELYTELDGTVDAFGVGGAEFFLEVGKRRYYFRDCKRISRAVQKSKIGDGNGVKGLLAKRALLALEEHLQREGKTLRGLPALKTNAVDRYQMAEALVNAGCDVTFGDFMFTLGLPIAVHSLSTVRLLAAVILPWLTKLPYTWFYPLGAQQDKEPEPRYTKYYERALVLAGDFVQIRAHMPDDLSGKIIVTNTTTARNVEELQRRGLHMLVTTTPRLEGRSFGTNVMEATMLALMDKPQSQVTEVDFLDMIERIPIKPTLEVLN
ncbi:MAG: hypothetical protein AMJ88_12275 [Anaerolineae bacterium SM23_ 63]|nr:MAG: hypothetical protein AMJ88_12275 [Anaerolineae bacterium SM23_ 63]HEY45568.1 quinate 5-dehydrogenase [Anaerolineae bacterium]